MLLVELMNRLDDFYMSIQQTYYEFNLNDNINIFIESFDGISFSINEMNRNTLKIKTLKEITAATEEELNKKINDTMRNKYGITA